MKPFLHPLPSPTHYSPLDNFCDSRGISGNIKDKFIEYCKSMYASRYGFNAHGDTIRRFVMELPEDQLLDAWKEFIRDLKVIVPVVIS